MKERPIPFKAPMVLAILAKDGKTQTRRLIKPSRKHGAFCLLEQNDGSFWPYHSEDGETADVNGGLEIPLNCPQGAKGDHLWVKETSLIAPPEFDPFGNSEILDDQGRKRIVQYLASHPDREAANESGVTKATPSIFMSRWASRILLEVTEVRVQRLQDISEEDAIAEGVAYEQGWEEPMGEGVIGGGGYLDYLSKDEDFSMGTAKESYRSLWEFINGAGSWEKNPWVWAITFKRINP